MDKAAQEASQMHKDFGGKFTNAVEVAIAAVLRARDDEIARWKVVVTSNLMHLELTQARAERDACVGTLQELQGVIGNIRRYVEYTHPKLNQLVVHIQERIAASLAQLPHAAERARLVEAVVQAARSAFKCHMDWRHGQEFWKLKDAFAALNAHDSAGSGEGVGE